MRRSPVRTTRTTIDPIPHLEELGDLGLSQSVPGLHRRLATHHVEHVGQGRLFIVPIKLPRGDLLQQFGDKRRRLHPTRDQERGKGMDGDRMWPRRREFDAQSFQERLDQLDRLDLTRVGFEDLRNQLTLGLQVPFTDPPGELLEHHPFMQGMLIDDDQATGVFGHDERLVNLKRLRSRHGCGQRLDLLRNPPGLAKIKPSWPGWIR